MKYSYLFLGTILLIVLGTLLLLRKDIRRVAVKTGCVGGVAGLIAELFYYRDYWRPPTVLGIAKISPEDFIFGFSITAVSVVIYMVVWSKRLQRIQPGSKLKLYGAFYLVGMVGMVILNVWLGFNSIFISSGLFLFTSFVICMQRRDLLLPAIYSALLVSALLLVVYILLFDVLSPHYIQSYFLLQHTRLNFVIFGHVPLTELLWYFSWAFLASISYPYVGQQRFVRVEASKP